MTGADVKVGVNIFGMIGVDIELMGLNIDGFEH